MGENADYDAASIHVMPDDLKSIADHLDTAATDVADSIRRINDQLGSLALGWSGATQQEAEDFSNQWSRVMNELFGTEDHPEQGVLNAIVGGLRGTGGGFSKTEHALADMFRKFKDNMNSGGGGTTPADAPADVNDITQTAITEDW